MSHKLSSTEPTIRRNSCLPVSLAKYATKLGGTFSAGCRAALEFHRDNAKPMAAFVAAYDVWVNTSEDWAWSKMLSAREALRKMEK